MESINGRIEHLRLDQLFTQHEYVTSFELGSKDKYVGTCRSVKSNLVHLIFKRYIYNTHKYIW